MLIRFSQTTFNYHKAILGLIIISMILVMSQISLHGLMFQQKLSQHKFTSQQYKIQKPQLAQSINTLSVIDQHCAQSTENQTSNSLQCQSIISISDSLSVNSVLSANAPEFISLPFSISFFEPAINQLIDNQLAVFNFIIKTFFPPLTIRLHSFLI